MKNAARRPYIRLPFLCSPGLPIYLKSEAVQLKGTVITRDRCLVFAVSGVAAEVGRQKTDVKRWHFEQRWLWSANFFLCVLQRWSLVALGWFVLGCLLFARQGCDERAVLTYMLQSATTLVGVYGLFCSGRCSLFCVHRT